MFSLTKLLPDFPTSLVINFIFFSLPHSFKKKTKQTKQTHQKPKKQKQKKRNTHTHKIPQK